MHTSNCSYTLSPPPVTSSLMSQNIRLSSTKAEQDPPEAKPHIQLRSGAELKERTRSVEEGGLDLRMKNSSSSSSSGRSSETTAESQAPAKSGSSGDGQVRQTVRAEVHGDDTSVPGWLLQRCLSIEDVSRPSSVRSVGRVLQVCSDGTFLLEVSRPKGQIYGFIISRGRGRPNSGVYVEDMVDSSTKKLYAGLLAVGDEILEVNGEKVACLSLDKVTHLLTQSTSATIRVLRHRQEPLQ
ncbi:uncharacterized protein LOC116401303 isoform X1 [Anarrhichthys ocellatus]|uniref:uncharacterized protein LOC116401303 isoform X1 n=1 Tax=Anarrhichthys ocellatus TaxID=433405 RepID=UPI0012EE2A09|nr:uncharacterized protein LOC116401303 isoform X1 [Anarrhichthys ocellatus]